MKNTSSVGSAKRAQVGIQADMAIVAEPTELEIVASHKGVVRWKIITEGVSVHSANRDEGINAIVRMAAVVRALEHFHQQVLRQRSDPELGHAALSIGCIRGGTSVNTVPNRCEIEIDRRLLPGEDRTGKHRGGPGMVSMKDGNLEFDTQSFERSLGHRPRAPAGRR